MRPTLRLIVALALVSLLFPSHSVAQIASEKTGYYLSLGDSVAAGEGAQPATNGFVYQLYQRGVFGQTQATAFGNIAIKGATTDEVQVLQAAEALCIQPPRIFPAPTVITLTAGANDLFLYIATHGIPPNPLVDIPVIANGIADKVANIIRSLVFGLPGLPPSCAQNGIPGITVLTFNYYDFNHPDPQIDFLLNLALQSFSARLQAGIAQIQAAIAATGRTARVGFVDTFSAMEGRSGLLLIEKRNGFSGPFEFEIHPTNAGHTVIAKTFEDVWNSLQ